MNGFSDTLIAWYQRNKRDLPWRQTSDPYAIWLSEIILQQTQVAQGLAYYLRFLSAFPSVLQLAEASEDEVLKLWQGLGYYSRARNLHATAKAIVQKYDGRFPDKYPLILDLKGVGDYTAAAISSFAFNLPHAVVDGNVYRLLSRVFGIELPIDSTAGKKTIRKLADELLHPMQPALHNQAIMEFGSQYCKPVNPDCLTCIFSDRCLARQKGLVEILPVKEKKTKIRPRFFHYLVLVDSKNRVLLQKRQAGDIWQGLYEFYLVEKDKAGPLSDDALLQTIKEYGARKPQLISVSETYKHVLSHQHLFVCFYLFRVQFSPALLPLLVSKEKFAEVPLPRLLEKFATDCGLTEIV